jgi:hypothetical protein
MGMLRQVLGVTASEGYDARTSPVSFGLLKYMVRVNSWVLACKVLMFLHARQLCYRNI